MSVFTPEHKPLDQIFSSGSTYRIPSYQRPVPSHDDQYSDVFCQPRPNRTRREQVPHLGLLWDMTATICTIEPCSKTPTLTALRMLARKQLNLHHQLCKQERDEARPLAPQWVLSPGLPVSGLASLPANRDERFPPGFYRTSELLNQRLVVLSELPKSADTRLLRLMGSPELRQEALAELAELQEDDPARQPLVVILNEMVYLASKQAESVTGLSTIEREQMTELRREFEQFQANLLRTGAARGKAEVLLAVLAARGVVVSELVRQKILACTDLAALDQWVVTAATAASPEDVLTAAA